MNEYEDIFEELKQYSQDILEDKPLSCIKHKWACQRFLSDVERMDTDEFPYVFDEARAFDIIKWFRLFKHHKGVLAGQFIEPVPLQRFILGNVYGWVHRETGLRRFEKLYWQVAKKNAKSQTLSCIANYENMVISPDEAKEVYVAATDKFQADIVFDEAIKQLETSDYFKNETGIYKDSYHQITHLKSGSVMRSFSREDVKKSGHGKHPSCAVVDEYALQENSEAYDNLSKGMLGRQQPLHATITTAGKDLTFPCYAVEYQLVSAILNPDNDIEYDEYFVMINELDKDLETGELIDDIADEKCWGKANPIAVTYEKGGLGFLRRQFKEAQLSPDKMTDFLIFHMNVWVMMRESGYMYLNKWTACSVSVALESEPGKKDGKMPELIEQYCYLGGDLGAKDDLTALSWEFKVEDTYYFFLRSFIPEETLQRRMVTDKRTPWLRWIDEGWLIKTSGGVTKYTEIMNYGIDFAKERGWYIQEWGLDEWHAEQLMNDLVELGHVVEPVIQGYKTLSEPTKDFRNQATEKKLVHEGNPMATWYINNAIITKYKDNIMLHKEKSKEKIDGLAAMINSHVRCMLAIRSVYEERGLLYI